MDRPAFGEEAAAQAYHGESGGLHHLLRGVGHVLAHLLLIVAEIVMKAQDRDSPPVLHFGVEVDVVLVAREDFAEAAHRDHRPGVIADPLLVVLAEAWGVVNAVWKHRHPAAPFEAVTANEIRV